MTELPLDYTAIERILPHRYPFLLVDRVTELEPDKRIVGIKNVSLNERYLSPSVGQHKTLPSTLLTEAVAQVGAILILSKPENREKLIFFMGIAASLSASRVPGDVVEIGRSSSVSAAAWRAERRGAGQRQGGDQHHDVRARSSLRDKDKRTTPVISLSGECVAANIGAP